MVTEYQIPCSCGCGELVKRPVYKFGACKVRAYRDKEKQIILVNGGDVVEDYLSKQEVAVYGDGRGKPVGLKKLKEVKTVVAELPEEENIKQSSLGWQPPSNLSKAHFARRGKGSKHK